MLWVVRCQRELGDWDMTLNIPAYECQIHLFVCDGERERKRASLFLFGVGGGIITRRNDSKCALMSLNK